MVELITSAILAFVGFAITDNIIHPSNSEEDNKKIFTIGAVITTVVVIFFQANILENFNPMFSLIGIGVVGAYFYIEGGVNIKSEEQRGATYHYLNHCWSCNKDIDSQVQKRCSACGWYICDQCSACGCHYTK
jgi:hypothetical protein